MRPTFSKLRSQCGLALLTVALLVPRPALAEPARSHGSRSPSADTAHETPEYRESIRRGVAELEAGNFAEARALFTRAHAIYPNARTFRALGLTAYELRNYGVCVESLENALVSQQKPLDGALRRSSEEVLNKARAFLAQLDLRVSPQPARVLIDGLPISVPEGKSVSLTVGDHVIEVQAPGYEPERRSISVTGGETLALEIPLQAVRLAPEGKQGAVLVASESRPPQTDAPVSTTRRWYKSPWLWVGVGVAIAATSAGVAYALRPAPRTESAPAAGSANTPSDGYLNAAWRF